MNDTPVSRELLSDQDARRAGSGDGAGGQRGSMRPIPSDALILLPMRNAVLFPGVVAPLAVGRASSVAAVRAAVQGEYRVGFLLQRDPAADEVGPSDLYWVGTAGRIVRHVVPQEGPHHLMVQGEQRFRVLEFLEGWPWLVARVAPVEEAADEGPETEARFLQLREKAVEAIGLMPQVPDELATVVQGVESPGLLADMVANLLDLRKEEKQEILETFSLRRRLDRVLDALAARVAVMKLSKEIGDKTRQEFDQRQKEHVLREQMRQIRKELGEDAEDEEEIDELAASLEKAGMPEATLAHARKELRRLKRMNENGAEAGMLRTWLEWMAELPWKAEPQPQMDLAEARLILDADHFGLEKVKKRIVEFLAVRKLRPEGRSPILCFVGPPGVGKTSLGQSIAKATGRPFQRVALGGVHDEAEIRGHRRTYVGALPGNVIQALKRAGSRGGVILFDEVDKLGMGGFHGDPASAMLEVLDPEQNGRFRDNYLGVDFDLSQVLFVATANQLDTIPGPLRDRMEIIQLPGYTSEEKLGIAKRHLLSRQLEANGLAAEQVTLEDAAIAAVIADYTREAGVRTLERELGAVLRHAAVRIAEGEAGPVRIGAADLHGILGPAKFENEVALRAGQPGVATGLAWTPVGGDILFIEASRVPGSGRLILTGQLGDVMKESAQAALTLVKTRLGVSLEKEDVHVHVPAGATPKDGPSAGVAMTLALVSLLTNRPVRHDVAMTGEVSLRGQVLPIGGVKEKTLAALRAGIGTVMLPRRNLKDLEDVPAEARARLRFIALDRVEDAIDEAIGPDIGHEVTREPGNLPC